MVTSLNFDSKHKHVSSSFTGNQQLRHRRVKHFGYEFLYGTNNVDKSNPSCDAIPSVCDGVLDRIQKHVPFKPDQMTINEYKPGQGMILQYNQEISAIANIYFLISCPRQAPLSF